jgi:CMP-N,N'-diacetyllegionaminic acid synthase
VIDALCIICAREGSKRLPGKNIQPLFGKPLIAHSITQALEAKVFEHVVISTDDDEIATIAVASGGQVIFRRPTELATEFAPKLPVIKHALVETEKHYDCQFSIIVDLDPTAPIRRSEHIRATVERISRGNFNNLLGASKLGSISPYFNCIEQTTSGTVTLSKPPLKEICRTQDCPTTYVITSIYAWKRDALLAQDALITDNTGLIELPEECRFDVDESLDFEIVELIMKRKKYV